MLRRFVLTGLLVAFGWAGTAHALGLGNINLRSALNEPLDAEIRLLSATPEELRVLTVNIASVEAFQRYGLDRPGYLTRIRFTVEPSGGGLIKVQSSEPITEPFVTVLVEAVWPRGRLLREYTVLLDPPVFASRDQAQPQPRTSARQPARDSRPATVQRPPTRSAAANRPAYDGDSYTVQRNDTLWEIAQSVRPEDNISMNQMMLSLFQANPQAFAGNINLLNAGATLRIPSAPEIYNIGRTDALAEVRRQNSNWRQGTGQPAAAGSLVLVPPDADTGSGQAGSGTATQSSGAAGSSEANTAKLRQLESENAEQRRLIEVKDQELAQLRQRLAEQQQGETGTVTDEPAAADDGTSPGVDLEGSADPAGDEVFVEDAADDAAGDTTDAGATDAAVDEPARPVIKAAPAPEETLVDRIVGFFTGIWGIILLGLLGLAGLLFFFARRRGDDEDSTGTWEALDDFEADEDGTRDATSRLRALAVDDDSILVVEADELAAAPTVETAIQAAPSAGPTDTSDTYSLEDTFSSETAINLDQSDPVAEADFHMAYGLYDQAADLLKGAISTEPDRRELKSKLAEVYFVWGNKDGFVEAAEQVHGDLGDDADDTWDKIKIMGQQIAPAHALFAGAAASIDSVDLDFADGGTGSLDSPFGAGDSDGLDIDVGSSFGADESDLLADNDSLDFSFDEESAQTEVLDEGLDLDMGFDLSDDSGDGPTIERMVPDGDATQETPTIENLGFDAPTIESPGPDSPTIESLRADDAATIESPVGGVFASDENTAEIPLMDGIEDDRADATAEINLDDLGLDLSGLDTGDDSGELELPDLDELDIDSSIETVGIDPEMMEKFAESVDEPDDPDLGASVTVLTPPTSINLGDDRDATGAAPSLTGSDMDLDLDDLTAALQRQDFAETGVMGDDSDSTREQPLQSLHKNDLEGDIFADSMAADDGLDLGSASNDDDDAPTVMPMDRSIDATGNRTMTEVGTKLDLARAYIDMGDPDGARSILTEVADEGDSAQQQEARKLLDSLS